LIVERIAEQNPEQFQDISNVEFFTFCASSSSRVKNTAKQSDRKANKKADIMIYRQT